LRPVVRLRRGARQGEKQNNRGSFHVMENTIRPDLPGRENQYRIRSPKEAI
jgi:hypothetical protein